MSIEERSKLEELIQEARKAASVCWTLIDAMRADGLDETYPNTVWVIGDKLDDIEEELSAMLNRALHEES